MASGFTNRLVTGSSNTDSTQLVFGSATPTNGRPLWLFASSLYSAAPSTPTASGTNGFGNTWTQIATVTVGNRRLTAFRSTAASSVAGVVTVDWGAETQLARAGSVHQGQNISSDTPVQSKTTSASGAGGVNFDGDPLAAFANVWNCTLGCFALSVTSAITFTTGNVSQLANGLTASDGLQHTPFFAPLAVASPAATHASADALGIALELTQDGSDVGSGDGGGPLVGISRLVTI